MYRIDSRITMIFILEEPMKRRGIGETLADRRGTARNSYTITFEHVVFGCKLLITNKKIDEG